MKNNKLTKGQPSFALILKIGIPAIILAGAVGFFVLSNNHKNPVSTKPATSKDLASKSTTTPNASSGGSTTQSPTQSSSSKPKTPAPTSIPQSNASQPASTEPTISIISPSNGATVGANPTFSVRSNAPNGFEQISVDITNTNMSCGGGGDDPRCYGYSYGSSDASNYPNLSFIWDTETEYPRYNNPYKVEATVEDKLGHQATASIVINLQR